MPTTVTRIFEFDAAHRVLHHGSKCQHLHGHRYVVEVVISNPDDVLDQLGMVVDFGVIKEIIGDYIDTVYDHNSMFNSNDLFAQLDEEYFAKPPVMFFNENPTAENIARKMHGEFTGLLSAEAIEGGYTEYLIVDSVTVRETPKCFATYTPPKETKDVLSPSNN